MQNMMKYPAALPSNPMNIIWGFISVSKQCARAFVDEERTDTARHTPPNPVMVATALFGQHIAHYGVDVGTTRIGELLRQYL